MLSPACFASDIYQCKITEVVQAKFKHGKWIKTDTYKGKAEYFIEVNEDIAMLREKVAEYNELYPIKTSCSYKGGTAGYSCNKFTKITPYGEKYRINFYPSLNEITIDAQYTMREMIAYSKEYRNKNRKYFSDITMGFTKSYGKCKKQL